MATKINFTLPALTKATPPAGVRRAQLYDLRTPGLYFEVTAKGSRSFYLYRWTKGAGPQRVRLGGFPEISIDKARQAAAEMNGDIAKGIDPRAERRKVKASLTLAELFANYLERHAKIHKKTWDDDIEQFERYFGKAEKDRKPTDKPVPFPGWRNRRANTIHVEDIESLHAKIGANHGKYAANRMLALISSMFNKAKLSNPAKGVTKFEEQQRKRFLHPDELPSFFTALASEPNPTIRDFILIAIFTGARRSNIQAMRWEEVNLTRATWEIPNTKSGEAVTVHLSPPALKILTARFASRDSSPFVFPSYGKTGHLMEPKTAWAGILDRAGIKDLRLHDLRRTLGSWQAAAGASLPIIGKSLGHKDGSPATAIYARLHLDPVKQSVNTATAAMAQHLPAGLLPEGNAK